MIWLNVVFILTNREGLILFKKISTLNRNRSQNEWEDA